MNYICESCFVHFWCVFVTDTQMCVSVTGASFCRFGSVSCLVCRLGNRSSPPTLFIWRTNSPSFALLRAELVHENEVLWPDDSNRLPVILFLWNSLTRWLTTPVASQSTPFPSNQRQHLKLKLTVSLSPSLSFSPSPFLSPSRNRLTAATPLLKMTMWKVG